MSKERLGAVVQCIRALADAREEGDCTDGQLLDRFVANREEAAFAALMNRHGPMVLGVCRRIVGHHQDADGTVASRLAEGIVRKPEHIWLPAGTTVGSRISG